MVPLRVHPESCRCERPDAEEYGTECRETVRESESWRTGHCDHVHESCDCQTDPCEHPAEKQREVGVDLLGHAGQNDADPDNYADVPDGKPGPEPSNVVPVLDRRIRRPQANRMRAQANLLALVAALVALTTAMVLGFAVADSALGSATRATGERHAATSVASALVADDTNLTNRANVLNGSAVTQLTAEKFRTRYPVLNGLAVRVTLDGETLLSDGTVNDGTTVRRIVIVERARRVSSEPRFTGGNAVTLPRRTARVDLTLTPDDNRSISTVRAEGRTVLHAPGGLEGTYSVSLSRRETARLTFVANGSLERGDVTASMYPRDTRKAVLAVTVDD
jgi:hypothetical protein